MAARSAGARRKKKAPRGRGHARALDRGKIVEAAIALARERGAAALTMREVAARLDVDVSALYWHFPSKAEMLAAVSRAAAESIDLVAPDGGPWPERVLALCRTIRGRLRDHPELGLHEGGSVWTTPFNALATGRLAEALEPAGLAPRETILAAQSVLHTVTAITQSELLGRESSRAGTLRFVESLDSAVPASLTPALRELLRLPPEAGFDAYFEFALRTLIDGIAAQDGA